MNSDITYSDFEGFDTNGNYNRPRWIGIHRTGGAIDDAVTKFLIKNKDFAKIASAVADSNTLAYWKDIYSQNMAAQNGPNNLNNWHKKYALVLQKFLELLILKARALSRKELKKELKRLKAEFLDVQAKKISEEERIKLLNEMIEKERQKGLQPVSVVENTKPKELYKPKERLRLTKKDLIKLLAELGLQLGANKADIQKAYKAKCEDKAKHPEKYSEQEWAEIEEAFEILSSMEDSELKAIAQSREQLMSTEAKLFLETLKLEPSEPHTIQEIEQAYFTLMLENALNATQPDPYIQRLYHTFVNQTEGMRPQELINLHQLIQEQEQTFALSSR